MLEQTFRKLLVLSVTDLGDILHVIQQNKFESETDLGYPRENETWSNSHCRLTSYLTDDEVARQQKLCCISAFITVYTVKCDIKRSCVPYWQNFFELLLSHCI